MKQKNRNYASNVDATSRGNSPKGKSAPKNASSAFTLRLQELLALFCAFLSVYICISLFTFSPTDPSFNHASPVYNVVNSGGLIGAYVADFLLQFFALSSFILPMIFVFYAYQLFRHKETQDRFVRLLTLPFVLVSLAALFQMWQPIEHWPTEDGFGNGGMIGKLMLAVMVPLLGKFGACAISSIIFLLSAMWWTGLTLIDLGNFVLKTLHVLKLWVCVVARVIGRIRFKDALQMDLALPTPAPKKIKLTPRRPAVIEKPVNIKTEKEAERVEAERQEALPLDLNNDAYQFPSMSALDDNDNPGDGESEEALQQNARMIEAQLGNFGIKGEVTKICPGPIITIYELEPAAGVKTSAIVGLSNDLARSMSALAIRIAPIPGRSVIGIEMPNRNRQMVAFKDLVKTEEFETDSGKLTVAMGVDTAGKPVFADIGKMPHALIAGTTGSGKSVAMNAFIVSLLYRMTPDQLRFVMIDPKMLELSIYNDIPHLVTPVIIDPNKASAALKWVVCEMENRYRMMTELGVKNIQSFNAKFTEMQERGETPMRKVQTGFDPETGQPTFEEQPVSEATIPYLVVVIDELADLMMVAGKEVEISIARLAQMARASGIHLLIATQRPSVDVITGLIKANIPTRISFSVTSKIDSRTVLDSMGAEQLLGRGDMLWLENGSNTLQRLHGAFISEEECHRVVEHVKKQGKTSYVDNIFKAPAGSMGGGSGGGSDVSDDDPLYRQAIEVVAREQKASTSFIQRHLKIGYNRAATLVEKMEQDGLISEANHVGKREVIVKQPPEGGY